jgi:hypothetical protein
MEPWERNYKEFSGKYIEPFHRAFPDHHASYMLDLIADEAFDPTGAGGTLQPASKAAVFQEFTLPDEQDDPAGAPPVEHTMEAAEAALAFLVEQGMVEVVGDVLTVPARFWPALPIPAI